MCYTYPVLISGHKLTMRYIGFDVFNPTRCDYQFVIDTAALRKIVSIVILTIFRWENVDNFLKLSHFSQLKIIKIQIHSSQSGCTLHKQNEPYRGSSTKWFRDDNRCINCLLNFWLELFPMIVYFV